MGQEQKKTKKSKSKENKKRSRQEYEGEEEIEVKPHKKIRQNLPEETENKTQNTTQAIPKDEAYKENTKQKVSSKLKKKAHEEKQEKQEQTEAKKRKSKKTSKEGPVQKEPEAKEEDKKLKKSKKSARKQKAEPQKEKTEQEAEKQEPVQPKVQEDLSKEKDIPHKKKSAKKEKDLKPQVKQQQAPDKEQKKEVKQESIKKKKKEKKEKSESCKKPEKVKSINAQNLQMSKQCHTQKSNFYIQKQIRLKQGLPVGRGSKKAQQEMEEQRKKKLNQRNKKKKTEKKSDISENNEVKQENEQEDEEQQSTISKQKTKLPKPEPKKRKDDCTTQQSIRIINVYAIDAGDYRGITKQLPDIPQPKIRAHLRMLFQRCLDIITKQVQATGRNINDWQIMEKREIVRQLHRIRCTNRLLSQQNVEFREKFLKLMMSYNDPSLTLTSTDFSYLYRKLEAFVRGFCSIAASKKKPEVKLQDSFAQNRKPLMEGGYIMDRNRVKKEAKIQSKIQEIQQKKIDPQKIILEWTQQEEKQLGRLYILHQANVQTILEQMKIKFGFKNRWKDFQLLTRKLDHLVKMGLNKLLQLTSKPYNRQQRLLEQQEKSKQPISETDPNNAKTEVTSLDLMTKFIYNNKKVAVSKPEEVQEGGIFKNVALLQRQIFGHVESFKSRFALVKLLEEKFPHEEEIEEAIKTIKQFAVYAIQWQKANRVLLLKQDPVLEEDAKKSEVTKFKTAKEVETQLQEEDKERINSLAEELEKVQTMSKGTVSQNYKKPEDLLETNAELNLFEEGDDIDELMRAQLQQ